MGYIVGGSSDEAPFTDRQPLLLIFCLILSFPLSYLECRSDVGGGGAIKQSGRVSRSPETPVPLVTLGPRLPTLFLNHWSFC